MRQEPFTPLRLLHPRRVGWLYMLIGLTLIASPTLSFPRIPFAWVFHTKPTGDATQNASWAAKMAARKKWWSFQPIQNPTPPTIPTDRWASHPVDRFVLAQMRKSGLNPAPTAEAHALVRRLYFTLIGLPPTPEELTRGVAQLQKTGGYEALVDSLLARPQFGEAWARHWMDWIRYADSHGSEGDPEIQNGWLYRDYLIRALNGDVGYDQLVREHIAGDLLTKPRFNRALGINESIIGPAHWRMVFHGFAPTDALEEKVRFTDDEIAAFSKGFLGLTISCARCHDHKFDPISQKDYYALFGVLNSCRPGRSVIDLPEKQNRNRQQLAALKPSIRTAIADAWLAPASETSLRLRLTTPNDAAPIWKRAENPDSLLHPLLIARTNPNKGEARHRIFDGWRADRQKREQEEARHDASHWNLAREADYRTWFRQGNGLPDRPSEAGEFAVACGSDGRALAGIYPAGIYTHSLSPRHAARLTSGYVRLGGDYELWARVIGDGGSSFRYVVQNYPRDGTVFPVVRLTPNWQWARLDMTYWNGDEMHVELAAGKDAPLLANNEATSWFGVRQVAVVRKGDSPPSANPQEYLDPIFTTLFTTPEASKADIPASRMADGYLRAIMGAVRAWRDGVATDAQASLLGRCLEEGLLPNTPEALPTARPLLTEYRRLEAEIESPTRVPGLEEAPVRNQPLYIRGNHKTPGSEVPRAFLEVVDSRPYPTNQSGRLQLAEDLLRDDNPLTRRVIVNRIWHHLFGKGLVATPDNFGRLGMEPTHPELLDYLATRFKKHDWSIKETIRFLVTSRTWQQGVVPSPLARKVDPDNRLLSHANVHRLEAEAIRDSLLAVSGNLQHDLYGPPVGGGSDRRSVYVRVQRTALDPFLRSFDCPEPFSAVGRRDVTNVPAQSLTLMNDERVAALAARWARRILDDPALTRDEDRVQRMFVSALGRSATPVEVARSLNYLRESQSERQHLTEQVAARRKEIDTHSRAISALTDPLREHLLTAKGDSNARLGHPLPQPIGRWDFKTDTQDLIGSAHGTLKEGAHLQEGALVLDGRGYLQTAPLKKSLREKTLEAWVQLDTLNQAGGGVMSVMTPDGGQFDAIVFGEQQPQRWMSGSAFFQRTQSFNAPAETEATQRPVHLAIAYHADGSIVAYRDGLPYGTGYKSSGPFEFQAGQTVIGLGIRHLPAGSNKMLKGKILRAQLYDRALSADEVLASSRSAPYVVSHEELLAALSPRGRDQVMAHEQRIATLEAEIRTMGPLPTTVDGTAPWTDLARALFNFKEFLYLD